MLAGEACRFGPLSEEGTCALRYHLSQHIQGKVHSRLRGGLYTGHLCSIKKKNNNRVVWCGLKTTKTKPLAYLNWKSQDSCCFLYWEGCLFCEASCWKRVLLGRGGKLFAFFAAILPAVLSYYLQSCEIQLNHFSHLLAAGNVLLGDIKNYEFVEELSICHVNILFLYNFCWLYCSQRYTWFCRALREID